jgi:hypothetical protein
MEKRSIINYADSEMPNYGYSIHDIEYTLVQQGRYSDKDVKLFYLGYLCCQGDYASIVVFLQTLDDDEKRILLNEKPYDFYEGTVLHVLLYWNSGNSAINIFDLLVEHGAEFVQDYYGHLPWEQGGAYWKCEWRKKETYNYLRERYGEDVRVAQDLDILIGEFSQISI